MKQRELTPSRYQLAPPHATTLPHELIPLLPPNWPTEIPLARITTCGPTVSIEVLRQIHPDADTDGHPTLVYGPPDAALLEEKGASTALLLLAVLASQPHCSATKDWLSETLGHGSHNEDEDDLDESPGLKRVDNVATQLRHLLFPPVLRDLPTANQLRRRLVISYRATRESGSGYRLAGLPLLCIDVEAIGEHLKQARALDQFGHDGLPAWQAAYKVAGRGIFLEREPYSDWASWRRQQVETQLWQCVQALWRPLAQQGEDGETEAVRILQSYWQNHITNEDVLRPLIELLGKRECYGQAEEYYAHLCLALEQEDKQPDQRTQETMTFLRALQIQREPSQHQAISQERGTAPLVNNTYQTLQQSQQVKESMSSPDEREPYMALRVPSQKETPLALFSLDDYTVDILKNAMKYQEEMLTSLYEDMLIMGWDSFRRSKSPQISTKIDEHVQKLTTLAHNASAGKGESWQSLLCRFSQLSTRIAQHRMNESRALDMAKRAIMIAIDLDDAELIASTFYGRGRVHMEYSHTTTDIVQKKRHFERAKADIDAALGHVTRVRIPLAGNIYLLAAEIYALIADNDTTLRTQCEKWQDNVTVFVENGPIEDDGSFLKLNPTALHHEKAKTLLRFGKIEEAHRELNRAWETLQPNLFTWHMNMHLTQATLSLARHEIEESAKSSRKAYMLAKTIHSHKGEVEVQRLFEHLQHRDEANSFVRDLKRTLRGDA